MNENNKKDLYFLSTMIIYIIINVQTNVTYFITPTKVAYKYDNNYELPFTYDQVNFT